MSLQLQTAQNFQRVIGGKVDTLYLSPSAGADHQQKHAAHLSKVVSNSDRAFKGACSGSVRTGPVADLRFEPVSQHRYFGLWNGGKLCLPLIGVRMEGFKVGSRFSAVLLPGPDHGSWRKDKLDRSWLEHSLLGTATANLIETRIGR